MSLYAGLRVLRRDGMETETEMEMEAGGFSASCRYKKQRGFCSGEEGVILVCLGVSAQNLAVQMPDAETS